MAVSSPSSVGHLRSENEGPQRQPDGAELRHQRSASSLGSGRGGFIPALLPSFRRRNRSSPALETLSDERGDIDGGDGAAATTGAGDERPLTTVSHGSIPDHPSEPILVRAYSPPERNSSTTQSSNDSSLSSTALLPFPPTRGGRIPLPPVEAYSFDAILNSANVKPELDKTIDAIAGLCHTYQNNLNTEVEYLLATQQDLDQRTGEVDTYASDVLAETGESERVVTAAETEARELVDDLSKEAADVEGRLDRILSMLKQMGNGSKPTAEEFPRLAPLVRTEDDAESSLTEPSFASSSPILERTSLDEDPSHLVYIGRPLVPALTTEDVWPSRDEPESLQMPILSSSGVPIMERHHASEETVTRVNAIPEQDEEFYQESIQEEPLEPETAQPATMVKRGHKRPLSIASFFTMFSSPPSSKPPSIVISHTPSFPIGYDERIEEAASPSDESATAEATLRRILSKNRRHSRSVWSIAGIFGRGNSDLDTKGKAPVR